MQTPRPCIAAPLVAFASLLVVSPSAHAQTDTPAATNADRTAIVGGVHEIFPAGGLAGDVVAFGPRAFVVMTGAMGKDRLPLIAAAHFGAGRAVVVGHESFFSREGLAVPDNVRLASQIVRWDGGASASPLRVGLVQQDAALASVLSDAGCRVVVLTPADLPGKLDALDLCWMDQDTLHGPDAGRRVAAVQQWVRRGGGLVVTGPAWGWLQVHPGASLAADHPANRLLRPMGLALGPGSLEATDARGFVVDDRVPEQAQAAAAVDALQASAEATTTGPDSADASEISRTVAEALSALPAQNPLAQRIDRLCAGVGDIVPTPQTPVTSSMALPRLAARLYETRLQHLAPADITAHPDAASFPGAVPAGARRETRTIAVDTAVPGWHGTGLYAAPGDRITVTVPSSAAGKRLSIRVGAHTDTLWDADRWTRFPEITLERSLDAPTAEIASPFGGTVFVNVPEQSRLGTVSVTIANAVAAPRFVLGETTASEWQAVRDAPGPWAELVGHSVALTVPSAVVRHLDDPGALMARWDRVMDLCYGFFAAPRRDRPERYCVDRQISAGYMHSGYPIMVHEDVAAAMVNVETLQGRQSVASWGFYHEMGHNFQQPEWTWAEFGEVTNNLFSLYASEKLNHAESGAHPDMTEAKMDERWHVVTSAPGAERYYVRDPWYPLTMFWLLRHAFGWEPFTHLFAEFRALPESERPHTEQEKHDQFLTRFSRLTGHNLTAYLTAWGVELSPAAKSSVANLPTWMPDALQSVH